MTTKDIKHDRDDEPAGKREHGGPHPDHDLPKPPPPPKPTPLPSVPAQALPLYLADAVREWDPNTPKTKDVPKEPPVEVYLAADVQARVARPDVWKQVVLQNLVAAGIYRPAHEDDPRAAVNDLMAWSAKPLPHDVEPVLPLAEPDPKRRATLAN